MLGLADRARLLDLFETLMAGKAGEALAGLRALYDVGSDPALVIADLADIAHLATRLKILPEAAKDAALSEAERLRGLSFAERLSMPVLSRAWQILSRGLLEVQAAAKPIAAAEMLLIRLAYAANLPTPDEALKALSPPPRRRRPQLTRPWRHHGRLRRPPHLRRRWSPVRRPLSPPPFPAPSR